MAVQEAEDLKSEEDANSRPELLLSFKSLSETTLSILIRRFRYCRHGGEC